MLVDDRNQSMTYREARLFGEEYFNQVTARSLLMMVTENTIGSVLTYIHALRHNLVPMLLDKKTEKSRLAVIAEKYRPEYVAVPENLEWQPGTKYRENGILLGIFFIIGMTERKKKKLNCIAIWHCSFRLQEAQAVRSLSKSVNLIYNLIHGRLLLICILRRMIGRLPRCQ